MASISFQLVGTILLAYGLVFRNKNKIIKQTFVPTMTNKIVPLRVRDNFIDAYLCKWGLGYMAIGYFIAIFEPEWLTVLTSKFLAVAIIGIIIFIVARVHSECAGREKYSNTTAQDLMDNAEEGTTLLEILDD